MQILLLTISVSLFAFFAAFILFSLALKDKIFFRQRLQALFGKADLYKPVQTVKKQKSKIPVSKAFSEELSMSGIRMRPEEFLTLWFMGIIIPGGALAISDAHIITVLAVIIIFSITPPILVIRAKKKRLMLFEKQLGDALLLISNCLRSGLGFQQAMSIIAKEMPDPIAKEFSRTVKEIQFGNSMDEALSNMVTRVKSTDLMLTVSAVQIQRQVGGNLLEILDNISVTIKERLKLKNDIRVMTATGRISSVVVALIPVGIAGMLMLINPSYIETFFETSLGVGMLCTCVAMEVVGFLLIKKIVTIKY
jgi:tight adherence protein B